MPYINIGECCEIRPDEKFITFQPRFIYPENFGLVYRRGGGSEIYLSHGIDLQSKMNLPPLLGQQLIFPSRSS